MNNLKFNGLLKEVIELYPNINVIDFLQENLQIPLYKAEQLAARIEKQYCQKTNKKSRTTCNQMVDYLEKSALAPKAGVYSVESLSDKEFEYFIIWLFGELGYTVNSERLPAVSGFDFVVTENGEKIGVQARKFPKNCRITDLMIQMAQDSKRFHCCKRTIVLATTYFSEKAIADAKKFGIELWDKDTLDMKICKAIANVDIVEKTACFPEYEGSLLQSLLGLDKTEDFIVEKRPGGKYDLYLPNVKFPLLTFQASSDIVTRCVLRIKNNQPVGEFEGVTLLGFDRNNVRFGPEGIQAYNLIIQYLEEFLE
jgi:HJR/Mrr/RecB family endonuclease